MLIVYLFCFGFSNPGKASVPFLEMDLNETRKLAGQKGVLYFAFFTADWCAPCKWMEEETFQDQQLIRYVTQRYLAVKVDIDQRDGRLHQERFGLKMLPSILIFNAQGQLLTKVETTISAEELLQLLKDHDISKNRISSTPEQIASNTAILDSPKPTFRVYRAPLPMENVKLTTTTNSNSLPPPVVMAQPAAQNYSTQVPQVRSSPVAMAPRSERSFRIHLAEYHNYAQAIRRVGQLEAGFKEPVHLLATKNADGQLVYQIFIGIFAKKSAADQYLYYLRRKNMDGIVREMVDGAR